MVGTNKKTTHTHSWKHFMTHFYQCKKVSLSELAQICTIRPSLFRLLVIQLSISKRQESKCLAKLTWNHQGFLCEHAKTTFKPTLIFSLSSRTHPFNMCTECACMLLSHASYNFTSESFSFKYI